MITEEGLNDLWPNNIRILDSNISMRNYVLDADRKSSAPNSVFRTADILSCLSKGVNSISDIASICKLNKSTIHRLLKALGEAGLTMRDPISRRYYIGPLITEIASNPYITHEYLVLCAINEMRTLSNFSGESIGLNLLLGLQNVLVYEIPSTYNVHIVAKYKIASNIHAGAASKVLLSQLSTKKLALIMANLVLEPLTEHTVTDKEELMAQLKQIRRQGYAIDCGERIPGAMCISVPIKNYVLPTTLGILGPENRIKPRMADFTNELIASSARVSDNLKQVFKIK